MASALPLVAALTAAGAAAEQVPWNRSPELEARIIPDPEGLVPPFVVVGDAVELTANGLSLRIKALSESERGAYFQLRTDLPRDPLPPRAGFPEGFTVFELSFRNQSGLPMRFQPSLTACRWGKDNELLPVHLDMVFEMLRALHHGEPNKDDLSVAGLRWFHVEPLQLSHGESATKLIVYQGYGRRAKVLTLELGPLLVGTEAFSPAVDFLLIHPPKPKKNKN
jgi:hypothetical protein